MASEGSRPATMPAVSLDPAPAAPVPVAVAPSLRPAPAYSQASLFHAFRRCWRLAATLGLLAGILVGTLWWFSLTEQYTAEIRIRISAPWSASAPSSANEEEIARFQRSQAALMQSPTVLEEVLRQPEAAQLPTIEQQRDPLAWLGDHVTVAASPMPEILLLQVHASRAEDAAVLARTIAEVYRSTAANQRQASLSQLKEIRCRTEEALRHKRQQLAQRGNARLAAAEKECQQARFDLRVARAELTAQEQRRAGADRVTVSDKTLLAYLKEDAVGRERLRELEAAEDKIKRTIQVSAQRERDPNLPRFYQERDAARKKLDAVREEVRSIAEQNERAIAIEQYQAQLSRCRERVVFYEDLVKSLEEEVQNLGGISAADELRTLREEATAAAESLRKLVADQERLENTPVPTAIGNEEEWVAVQRKDPKGRLRTATLGGAGCCALLMLAVSWRELRLRRITAGSDLVAGLGLPVLGNVPDKRLPRTLAREQLDGGGRLGEAVDALRTVLLHDGGNGPRLILVTSAVPGEGKTTLASLLAASLARAWRKTLLLDADLRKPEAHQVFQTAMEPGLSEVLRDEAESVDVIQPTELSRLWMIPAGHWDAHAIQALAHDGAGRLFDPLKEQFDFIVIDACPILPVADALLLCAHADAVLLAVRSGVSRLPVVQAAQQRLATLGAPLRGVVLMGRDSDLDAKSAVYAKTAK
jgi:succinoglycan biosynthesis transport protein ExoP